jgi:hypothetical protein
VGGDRRGGARVSDRVSARPATGGSSVSCRRRPRRTTTESDESILARADCWGDGADWSDLRASRLLEISQIESTDFAAALFYNRLMHSADHGDFIRRIDAMPASAPRAPGLTIAIVPGAFYVESPHTGADGRLVIEEADRCGCRTALVPLRSFDSLAVNSAILVDWLRTCREKRIVLVSLSKGSADVKVALARPEASEAFRNVVAWIDLAGLISGTPLVGWLMRRPLRRFAVRSLFWFKGYPFSALKDIDRMDDAAPASLRLPAGLRTIHVIGVPRVRHLTTRLSRRGHRRLSPLGPSDGAILLGDATRLPGLVYPIWGADHYLRPPGRDLRPLIARLLAYLADELG